MPEESVVLRFNEVSFEYKANKKLLDEVSFSVRSGSRITLMGQNGAGKSTLFRLIKGEEKPKSGEIFLTPTSAKVALARQAMTQEDKEKTVREFFEGAFSEKQYDLDKKIKDIFNAVALEGVEITKKVKSLSGGQQARLLLAHALIQNPDILLLDEPTNNLDQKGIEHLTGFLMLYEKTVIVISHDADFLNAFSDGVLYLDVHTKKIEQYSGNYYVVVEEIKKRIERENMQNARMQAQIKEKRAKAEVFAHKGGKLRSVAKRMREAAEEAEEGMVEVRREDRTIRDFEIVPQEFENYFDGKIVEFKEVFGMKSGEEIKKSFDYILRKGDHLLISGPNGAGKTTFLENIAQRTGKGFSVAKEAKIGYYKQDFGNLDLDKTGYEILAQAMGDPVDEHELRSCAAGFLLDGNILSSEARSYSEGQKGLLSFCALALSRPGLLILDEPTNHINFRHLPIIAKALEEYEGAMILVSHIPDFVSQIRIDEVVDLGEI